MENLRLTFLIFGFVAIVAVLVHGLWTIRKKANGNAKPKFQSRDWTSNNESVLDDDSDEQFDAHGVGTVRVISKHSAADTEIKDEQDDNQQVVKQSYQEKNSINEKTALQSDDTDTAQEQFGAGSENDENAIKQSSNESHFSESDAETAVGNVGSNDMPEIDEGLSLNNTEMDFTKLAEEHEKEAPSKLYGSVVTQPKPEFKRSNRPHDTSHRQLQGEDNVSIPEPPPFLLKSEAAKPDVNPAVDELHAIEYDKNTAVSDRIEPEFTLHAEQAPLEEPKPISLGEQARKLVSRRKKSVADSIRKEPQFNSDKNLNEEQMRIDFTNEESSTTVDRESLTAATKEPSAANESSLNSQDNAKDNAQASSNANAQASKTSPQEQASDVLVLNVRSPADREITGAELLPMLLTLGLKFGEQDIFHRHVNTNGKGPVLFSLANLFKPGVFDIDNIENFSTRGLSLFMMLPIEGDPQQVFNMMHNAARKLAEEFSCQILDGSRGVLTKQGLQKYSERIRDFERKRINR